MRFAIEDTTDIDRPEFHHAPTFAAAIRLADDLGFGRADAIIDLKTRQIVAYIRPKYIGRGNGHERDIIINERVYADLHDIASKTHYTSIGPRYRHIIPDID